MLTGRKYRLALTVEQSRLCEEYGNACRAVWNTALEQRRTMVGMYQRGHNVPYPGYALQCKELAEAKTEHTWLKAAPAQVLQQTLQDLDAACREHGTFTVRWRSKARWSPSLRFPDGRGIAVERLNRAWGRARLAKLGWVRFRMSRSIGGAVRNATLKRQGAHWYIVFCVEDGQAMPESHPGTPVGVDRGVVVAAVTSTGKFHDRTFTTAGEKARYLRLQRKLSRQSKGSANRAKTLASMRRITGRATDRRADFCAHTANRLTTAHSVVALEELRTRNMTASARGTVEQPGSKVRQKAGLNRAILDKGWNRLENALRSAACYTGTRIVMVNPAYTSQTCHPCGSIDPGNRESQAVFRCTMCGHADHADVNAAKNILSAAGHAVPACGDLQPLGGSVKQEPASPRGVTRRVSARLGIPRL